MREHTIWRYTSRSEALLFRALRVCTDFPYQTVGGLSPLKSGVSMLPYSLGSSIASVPGKTQQFHPRFSTNGALVAWFISYWQGRKRDLSGQKYAISLGLAISALGFGMSQYH